MEKDTEHAARAVSRLAQQYREMADVKAIAGALGAEVQALEDAAWQVYEETLETAVGKGLDILGRVVLQAREGASDEVYRLRIRVRIRILRSSGTVEDLISMMVLLKTAGGSVAVLELEPASVVCRFFGLALAEPEQVVALLRSAKAGGVKMVVEYLGGAEADAFQLDAGPGLDVGHFAGAS